jgi:hypothetical protein
MLLLVDHQVGPRKILVLPKILGVPIVATTTMRHAVFMFQAITQDLPATVQKMY